MYDLISEYFPDIEELTATQLTTARSVVVNYLRPHFPDIEMSPGSVFGDMFVSPAAAFLAALTVSQNRFMSDLDLENVAGGVIYSCQFVERYLGNFAVKDISTLQSSGVVRLTFAINAEYTVNKGHRFSFNTDDLFYPRLPSTITDSFRILPAGSIPDSAANELALSQTSLTTWAVDLPLTGKMTAGVARGSSGVSTINSPALIGITAAVEFDFGLPPTSLPALAELARRTAYAASVSSRNSTRSFVINQWPETKVVSVVTTGDAEMQRSLPGSALALPAPAADIYFRSRRDYQEESQTVRLAYVPALRVFRGRVPFLHRPGVLESVRYAGDITLAMTSTTLYSRVVSARLPGSTGCGSAHEEFWLSVVPPEDGDGVLLVPRSDDDTGSFAMFTVTYLADPLLEPVSAMLTAADNTPVGVDVVVKAGPLITIHALTVRYRRKPGTSMALDTARAEIATYINGVGWPELFSEAAMVESMYAAGALRTHSVVYDASFSLTPAARRFEKTFDPDASSVDNWNTSGNSLPCATANITTMEDIRVPRLFTGTVAGVAELYAATDRNMRYYIRPEDITFVEIQ